MEEITELDRNKYHVMKTADIEKYLTYEQKKQLSLINTQIRYGRIGAGKKERGDWLVLNLDDELDGAYLYSKMIYKAHRIKVAGIAVALVNAILKAKGDYPDTAKQEAK